MFGKDYPLEAPAVNLDSYTKDADVRCGHVYVSILRTAGDHTSDDGNLATQLLQ